MRTYILDRFMRTEVIERYKWMMVVSLSFFIFHFSLSEALAMPKFEAGKRYHIVCTMFPGGCVTDGATAGKNTPLYYQLAANQNDESAWEITIEWNNTVTIRNAKTGKYVTYDGVRQNSPQLLRYVNMTDELDGDRSLWYLMEQEDGTYAIRNYDQWDHIWDVRVDSYCVGTYSNSGNSNNNQKFVFTNEEGTIVPERQPNETDSGFDVTSWLDATTESPDGWRFEGQPWTDPSWGNYWNGDANVVSPFLERWHDSNNGPLPDAKIYQQLDNLPPGNYTVQADIIAVKQGNGWWQQEEVGHDVWLFANDQRTEAGTNNEAPRTYSVDVSIGQEGTITLGISIENTNANWVATDNFSLVFHGTEEELIDGEKEKVRRELADYYNESEIETLIAQAGNNYFKLEDLRKSVTTMAAIDPLSKATKELAIDGRSLIYVESLDYYLCTLPLEYFDSDYVAHITYTPREGFGPLSIDNEEVASGTDYRFSDVSAGHSYHFTFKNENGTVFSKDVVFTSLPVVNMYGSFNNSYSMGSIAVHEPNKGTPQMFSMKAKWRGGITNSGGKHKRNYHVKLLDADGNKLDQSFFGLRNDNSWILESCQVDMSRIRNRVLTDLWNDYCTKPYYYAQEKKAMSGTRGRFVELILNGEYRGIYCMTENIDRKQMKLKQYDEETQQIHGQLWKSKDWSYAVFMGTRPDGGYQPKDYLSTPYENSEMWDSYQLKYPDIEDVNPTDWSTLYNAVNFVCTSSDAQFEHSFTDYFDLPVVMDYYILMETILSTDNHGKNMFFACYDKAKSKKITLGVWDMDATCGQRWSDDYWHQSLLGPEQDYATFIARNEHGDYNLFKRLRDTNVNNFNLRVRMRYRDLREGPLSTEAILNRFRTQLDEFKTCGAAQREYDRWSYDSDVAGHRLDFDNEMDYIDDWITRRMNYLDNVRFDIGSLPSSIDGVQNQPIAGDNSVYDMNGRRVGTPEQLQQLPAGIYVCNGQKIVVGR